MKTALWQRTTLLMALALVADVSVYDFDANEHPRYHVDEDLPDLNPYVSTVSDEQYTQHIHSMFDAYRGDTGGRVLIETDALIDTKYRTWKRNADMINSLLGLPKGMNDAGR